MKLTKISSENDNCFERLSFDVESDDKINQLLDRDSLLNWFIYDINRRMRKSFELHSHTDYSKRLAEMNGAYPFIPKSPNEVFMQYLVAFTYLNQFSNNPKIKFLDAGSGVGNILAMINFMAKVFNHNVSTKGLELDTKLVNFGNTFLGFPEWCANKYKPIMHQDITTYTRYSEHNIIYYYCPISNPSFEGYFEEYLEDECTVGTILIPNLKRGRAIHEDYRFKEVIVDIENYSIPVRMFVKIKEGPRKHSIINDISIFELSKDAQKRVKSHIKNVKTGDV